MRGRLRQLAVLLTLALLPAAGGCVPSDPAPSAVMAIQATGDQTKILYTSCTPLKIASVAVVAPTEPPVFHESDPPVWKVSFAAGSTTTEFVVGETPAGATVDVPLSSALVKDRLYTVVISFEDGDYHYEGFQLDKMGERVAYGNRYLTPDEFARASSCASP